MLPRTRLDRDRVQVRMDLRRSVGFGLLALAALAFGHTLNRDHQTWDGWRFASLGCALLVLVFGVAATRSVGNEIARVAEAHSGGAAGAALRILVRVVGYLFVVLAVLDVIGVDLSQFLVGGAVTGVVLGIAAQQSLGNFFAGIVLLLARPYVKGDDVAVYNGSINGPHEGVVTDVGLLYTTITGGDGLMHIPNSVLLASAVGPAPARKAATADQGPIEDGD